MAIGTGFSKTVTDGLIFGYDTGDTRNSYLGRPTTNLLEGSGMSNYNNVGGSVTTNLTTNGELYRGAPVYVQTLTALDGSGVSWLSNGNNPGLGVVTGGGGGLANRYTGHSIFFKPTVPMHSAPIFTHYSNIGGWQSCCNYEDMGDGWFRAYVIWYDTVTRSDGKYWAINPLSAVQGVPITIYWAGPFKEDLNVQNVSQYAVGSRSNTQSLKDLTGTYSIDLTNMSYTSDIRPDITFDATDDVIDTNFGVNNSLSQVTMEAVIYDTKNNSGYRAIIQNNVAGDDALYIHPNNTLGFWPCTTTYLTVPANRWAYVAYSYDGTTMRYSVNGAQHAFTGTCADCLDFDFLRIGAHSTGDGERFGGKIAVAKVYNRALTEGELDQNFRHYATRFGISPIQQYYEGANAANFVNNWNNSTTYTMVEFGGLGAVTAHGFSSGPVNYTLTLPITGAHSRIRYRVKWHMVDSLDNETSRLYVGDGSSETEYLTFTKIYNAAPNVSYAAGQLSTSWSGHQTYSYRPWAGGAYGADGYLNIDSGWIDHTSSTLTVRHYMGADQAQADEAMYLSHVEVLIAS